MRDLIHKILKESEDDFSWIELPDLPEGDSYIDRVKYALLNTEFELKYDGSYEASKGVWQIWLNNTTDKENTGVMVSERTPYFKPDRILSDLKSVVDNHKHEWYYHFYEKLYNILKQIPE